MCDLVSGFWQSSIDIAQACISLQFDSGIVPGMSIGFGRWQRLQRAFSALWFVGIVQLSFSSSGLLALWSLYFQMNVVTIRVAARCAGSDHRDLNRQEVYSVARAYITTFTANFGILSTDEVLEFDLMFELYMHLCWTSGILDMIFPWYADPKQHNIRGSFLPQYLFAYFTWDFLFSCPRYKSKCPKFQRLPVWVEWQMPNISKIGRRWNYPFHPDST